MKTSITQYGFVFGSATVTRLYSHERHGVWLRVTGKTEEVDIRVTKGGRIRVFSIQKTSK